MASISAFEIKHAQADRVRKKLRRVHSRLAELLAQAPKRTVAEQKDFLREISGILARLPTDNTDVVVSARTFLCSSVFRLGSTLNKEDLLSEFIPPALNNRMREMILENARNIRQRDLEGEFENKMTKLASLVDDLRGFGVSDEELDAVVTSYEDIDGVSDADPAQGQNDADHQRDLDAMRDDDHNLADVEDGRTASTGLQKSPSVLPVGRLGEHVDTRGGLDDHMDIDVAHDDMDRPMNLEDDPQASTQPPVDSFSNSDRHNT
ncbi:uncharacterized protein PHACADRAFT_213265 [Phanerochaete carnosa HHB-10118-sp]|uniref:Uncharacterized protein n=1 Tax=Phanerochaete carnosa (strain HHB-10118-sp) TaxID=650164 RepID=K5VXA4_PHACS|nr:uncharacterized protein PHACADRAFT_213265 [Phanerochaete carnosa HHB-10118-sp]EKM51435.1 hypothetical protein PHACADRAFT_213265 [Phanerochaete carnosa HHB-10118-sp]